MTTTVSFYHFYTYRHTLLHFFLSFLSLSLSLSLLPQSLVLAVTCTCTAAAIPMTWLGVAAASTSTCTCTAGQITHVAIDYMHNSGGDSILQYKPIAYCSHGYTSSLYSHRVNISLSLSLSLASLTVATREEPESQVYLSIPLNAPCDRWVSLHLQVAATCVQNSKAGWLD